MANLSGVSGAVVLCFGISVNPGPALAEVEAKPPATKLDVWEARPLSLALQLGVKSPGGLLGLEAEYGIQRWLAIGAGAGPTIMGSSETGWQAGAWLAPRWPFTTVALGLDLGASTGPYSEQAFLDEHGYWARYESAYFFNAAARFQYLNQRGLAIRAFFGAATLLNPADGKCGEGSSARRCTGQFLGYGGFSFGLAFASG